MDRHGSAFRHLRRALFLWLFAVAAGGVGVAAGSTYVVYIPLDSPIYDELETLNGLGYLYTYLDEVKPISRVEAARLTLEAQENLAQAGASDTPAGDMISELNLQLRQEIGWLEQNAEDNLPSMLQPVDRVEAQYIYSNGPQHFWNTGTLSPQLHAEEGTPLLPNNDGIPTASGSNEVLRWGAWGGAGGFLTGYGEGAVTGPLTYTPRRTSRLRALDAEAVVSLGNWALSFGQEEMWWGIGHFGTLTQSNNASPFPALRLQNMHPFLLPSIFRYLGQFRFQAFFGQLDGDRTFAHPWIDGQIFSFKPLPNFEFGFTHTIDFGGFGNDHYNFAGFLGRATGFSTGNATQGNTHSRGGIFLKFRFPGLRGLTVYQEEAGEDNLTNEARPIGRFLPFLSASYLGGIYLPRLTSDGRNDLRFEYVILQPGYSTHSDSLYYTYNNNQFGDALGPNAGELDFQIGHWFKSVDKGALDLFFTERAPKLNGNEFYPSSIYGPDLSKEHSIGFAVNVLSLSRSPWSPASFLSLFSTAKAHLAFEYVQHINYGPSSGVRGVASISLGVSQLQDALTWK